MGQIFAQRDQIGSNIGQIDAAWSARQAIGRQMRRYRRLKGGEALDWFGEKSLCPGLKRRLFGQMAFGPGCAENYGHLRAHLRHARDQFEARSIRQADIDDRNGGTVDIKVALRRGDTIGPPDTSARAQTHQTQRI